MPCRRSSSDVTLRASTVSSTRANSRDRSDNGLVADNLTPAQRRRCMSSVRTKDTDIEQAVRSALHRRGLRFRKHVRDLPGRPDIVFSRARVAVFVDGDFWHGYDFDTWRGGLSEFWRNKIETNRS